MSQSHDVLIFGASRGLGLCLAKAAIARGERVAAMVRPGSQTGALALLGVSLIQGDAFSLQDCIHALQQAAPRRVISVLGGKNAAGQRVDATGNIHVIEALEACCPQARFLLATSLGCGEQWDGLSEPAQRMLGEAIRAKNEAELRLKQSRLNWIIARPAGLNHAAASGSYRILAKPDGMGGYLSRADVAAAISSMLDQDQWLGAAWTILADVPVLADEEGRQ